MATWTTSAGLSWIQGMWCLPWPKFLPKIVQNQWYSWDNHANFGDLHEIFSWNPWNLPMISPYCFIFTSYPHGFLRSERRLQVDQNQHHQGSSGDGRPTRWCHRGAIVVAGGWVSCMSRCHGAKCLDLGAQQFFWVAWVVLELFWFYVFLRFFVGVLGSTFRVKLYFFPFWCQGQVSSSLDMVWNSRRPLPWKEVYHFGMHFGMDDLPWFSAESLTSRVVSKTWR